MSATLPSVLSDRHAICGDLEALVLRIHLVNGAWHALRDLWPETEADDPVLAALRTLKSTLQAQLLRDHHGAVWLEEDPSPELPERCYSLRLARKVGAHRDACHLPFRIAESCLTPTERRRFEERP